MQIELRNVKHYARMSQETEAFNASVYVDGVKVGDAENDGHGGCTNVRVPAPVRQRLLDYAKTLPNVSEYEPVESLIGNLLTKHLVRQDAKRLVKSKLAFIKDGKLLTTKKLDAMKMELWRAHYIAKGETPATEEEVFAFLMKGTGVTV